MEKDLESFHKSKNSKDGCYSYCKECKKQYDKKYRKSHKIQKLYKSRNYKNKKLEYQKLRNKEDPRKQMFSSARYRAKKFNLDFDINIDDIIIPSLCPLLEIPLFRKPYNQKGTFCKNSPSLDRIIPELGYIKGNIMVISMRANAMKYSATIDELKTFSKNINKIY